MAAATSDRDTRFTYFQRLKGPYAFTASQTVYAGTIATVAAATGTITTAADTAGLIAVGFHAKKGVAANGDTPEVMAAVGWLANNGNVTAARIGSTVTIVDDQTVGLAADTTNDIVAGTVEAVDSTLGVLVAIL